MRFRLRALSLALGEGWCHDCGLVELEWKIMVFGGDDDYCMRWFGDMCVLFLTQRGSAISRNCKFGYPLQPRDESDMELYME